MTKRILYSVLIALLLIVLVTTALTVRGTSILNEWTQEQQLREVAELVSRGYSSAGEEFLKGYDSSSYGITVIGPTGKVLNDAMDDTWYLVTDSTGLENFLQRVVDSSTVISANVHSLYGELLFAGRSFPDGTILVVTTTMTTIMRTFMDMSAYLTFVGLLAIIFSLLIARIISSTIVKPLNEINIDSPNPENKYKEIQPLLLRIRDQKADLAAQEKELRKQESRFFAVSGSLKEGLVLVDWKGCISYINKSGQKILGLEENPMGTEYAKAFSSAADIISKTLELGPQSMPFTKDNKTYQMETTLITSKENQTGVAVLIYDITHRLNEENRRREFTANVSHELKTPLHVISGTAELLASGLVKEGDQPQFVKTIYNETQRMSKLVDDIIGLSKIEEREKNVRKEYLDAEDTAMIVWEGLSNVAKERNITLKCNGSSAPVHCNDSMLYEIVYNLADNAIKYTNDGGHVTITTGNDGISSWIKVEDDGIGIAKENQDRVFERFYRVDKSRSRAVGGTGLGLSIVKHACKANGGSLSLESEMGKGTMFLVEFPYALPSPEESKG